MKELEIKIGKDMRVLEVKIGENTKELARDMKELEINMDMRVGSQDWKGHERLGESHSFSILQLTISYDNSFGFAFQPPT